MTTYKVLHNQEAFPSCNRFQQRRGVGFEDDADDKTRENQSRGIKKKEAFLLPRKLLRCSLSRNFANYYLGKFSFKGGLGGFRTVGLAMEI